ncbi:MAG: hypothetical protein JNK08_12715 [Sediminibacterium sp.]|nr:hypothetical protein [Sediminibacterium sp.]
MNIQNAIKTHLCLNSERDENGRIYESSLVHALRNIRLITGRNEETGVAEPNGYLGNWIGAIGYLTLLDQIGKCFRPKSELHQEYQNNTPPIKKALMNFNLNNLTNDEINAIYALRNGFHHDFSLLNIELKKNTTQIKNAHHFAVEVGSTNPVVKLPKIPWDGEIANRTKENVTYVNLQALGDMVENIYKLLLELESKNELLLELLGGESELRARYIFSH